jgi:hypothetical protein
MFKGVTWEISVTWIVRIEEFVIIRQENVLVFKGLGEKPVKVLQILAEGIKE